MSLRILFCPLLLAIALSTVTHANAAEDLFHVVPIAELTLADGDRLPASNGPRLAWRLRQPPAYARLDSGGEVYLDHPPQRDPGPGGDAWGRLGLRAPGGREVSGTLYLPTASGAGRNEPMVAVRFTVDGARPPARPEQFYRVMERHYQRLLSENRPGAAWFRHQARKARRLSVPEPTADALTRGSTRPAARDGTT